MFQRFAFSTALVALLASVFPFAAGQTPLGTEFTYQGELKQAGNPVTGTFNFEFRLFDALTLGNQIGAVVLRNGVSVTGGFFTVTLDNAGEFGPLAFDGNDRWLEIRVNGTTLAPRQPLTATPYALQVRGLYSDPNLRVVAGGTTALARVTATESAQGWPAIRGHNTSTANVSNTAGWFQMEGPVGSAVHGLANGTVGGTVGVWGESRSLSGYGVYGSALATSGVARGVYGRSSSPDGMGVFGLGAAVTGDSFGVRGETNSAAGRAVYGQATTTTGTNYGGYFETESTSGRGVYAVANAATGSTYGIYGDTASTTGIGVRGRAQAATGTTYGGFFAVNSTSGVGVYGDCNATTGTNYGVWGETAGSSGRGVYGNATSNTGFAVGVYGRSESSGGVGGLFTNSGGGTALQTTANASVSAVSFNQGGTGIGVNISNSNSNNPNSALVVSQTNTTVPAMLVNGTARVDVLEIAGADVAEKFPVSEDVTPGTVVMIDSDCPGKLCMSRGAYNKRVAGVVSGANGLSAGTILGNLKGFEDAPPIAMSGRVWVLCDAANAAIEVGDLLTTSDSAGRAMSATDAARSHGAVIGKAMTALSAGETGLVLVLVNLQ
jgi:hypothetical protein